MKRDLYALHDTNPTGAFVVSEIEARELNETGHGIFWTVNDFGGQSRKASNLVRLNSWAVEIDDLPKSEQWDLLESSPVAPNLIVESKRSFQSYWNCRDATIDNYPVIQKRLCAYFYGDPRAKDVARLLRAPGFNHRKDSANPFPVGVVWEMPGTYTDEIMLFNFPPIDDEAKIESPKYEREKLQVAGDDFWARIYALDGEMALKRLSGTAAVRGETYTFRATGAGNLNVWVNGKPSSAFIDAKKRIGSLSGGGPSIWQWLRWFGHNDKEVYQIIRDVFPEVLA